MWPSQQQEQWPSARRQDNDLEKKLQDLQLLYNKDKQFYEEALEARMSQIEELETKLE